MPLKSILFVPALRPDLCEKAVQGNATGVCIDLEDAVAPTEKYVAREKLEKSLTILATSDKSILVRLNSEAELISLDLAALGEHIDYVVLPKTGSAAQINALGTALDRLFGDKAPMIICLVESGADLDRLRQNTETLHPKCVAFALGTEDLAADLGTSPDAALIEHCFNELALLCRRWDVRLLGYPGSIAEFKDLDRFKKFAQIGARAGACGGFCIHPKQVQVLNDVFTPSPETIEKSKIIVDAFEGALKAGDGVVALNGKMIDRPVYQNAKNILARAE